MSVAVMGETQKSQIVRLSIAAQGVREHVIDL